MELDAFDFRGELLAQLLIFILLGLGIFAAGAERVEAGGLELGKLFVERRDRGEFLERLGLELLLHLGERQRIVLVVVVDRARHVAALDEIFLILVDLRRLLLGLFLLLEGGAGGRRGDLAFLAAFRAFLSAGDLLGGRPFRQHRLKVEDLAQLHAAVIERVRPFDDRVEGDRAFAQAPDHRVAAGLDPFGDGDLALAAEQFDRAHLAQIHAHRIVGAVDGLLLLLDDEGLAGAVDLLDAVVLLLLLLVALLGFDDVDAHLGKRRGDVLDLVGGHVAHDLVELVIGDHAALLGAGDQLLDIGFVEVDQRRIAAVLLVLGLSRVGLRHS